MNIWKYLPKSDKKKKELVRQKKKEVARLKIHGEMVSFFYSQKDIAEKEAEKKGRWVEELELKVGELEKDIALHKEITEKIKRERDYYKKAIPPVIEAAREVKRAREEAVVEILTGNRILRKDYKEPLWVKSAAIRVAKTLRGERDGSREEIEELKKGHLSEIVGVVGGYERIDRVPLMVYHKGDFIYETKTFEKMVRSGYSLERTLKENEKFLKAMNRGKRISMEYEGGELVFISEKLKKRDYVAVAYFVPGLDSSIEDMPKNEKKIGIAKYKRREKIFRAQGEKAARAIYKTLISFDKTGRNFANDGYQ
ncbi:MAG: hypothetical protein KKF50_01385 [Nanoarchaeota archaeon]|nr:hypothetical protein [Nanoarchaeota archaeon]